MRHLLYLIFRYDVDVMESLELGGVFWELNTAIISKSYYHDVPLFLVLLQLQLLDHIFFLIGIII